MNRTSTDELHLKVNSYLPFIILSWSTHDISSSTGSVILFLGYCEWHDGSCIFGAADGRRPSRHFGWLWSVAGNSMCRCGFRQCRVRWFNHLAGGDFSVSSSDFLNATGFFALNILSFTETNLLNLMFGYTRTIAFWLEGSIQMLSFV